MRRYLDQIACILRPGSVGDTDLALRAFAAFLAETAPERHQRRAGHPPPHRGLQAVAGRAARTEQRPGSPPRRSRTGSGRCGCSSSGSTSGAGTRRRRGCRCSPATCPARTTRCPRRWTTPPRRSCCAPPRTTSGCSCGSPWRCCCAPGCGSASTPRCAPTPSCSSAPRRWLHVPVGKLREDRYLPLHPNLVDLIDAYRAAHVPAAHPLLLPRENGKPLDRHTVTRFLNKAGAAAGLRAHPPPPAAAHPGHPGHQPRHVPGGDRRDARAQAAWT